MRNIEYRAAIIFAVTQCVFCCWADAPFNKEKQPERVVLNSSIYALNLQGCPIEFKSKPIGYTAQQATDLGDASGSYRHAAFHKWIDLNIVFECRQEPVYQRCPEELDVREDDPSTLQRMQVVRYKNVHPRYAGGAVATTFTAVNPPRSRQLKFCLGDDHRTLVGRGVVGNEQRALTAEVLRIVASIRFTDEVGLKK